MKKESKLKLSEKHIDSVNRLIKIYENANITDCKLYLDKNESYFDAIKSDKRIGGCMLCHSVGSKISKRNCKKCVYGSCIKCTFAFDNNMRDIEVLERVKEIGMVVQLIHERGKKLKALLKKRLKETKN